LIDPPGGPSLPPKPGKAADSICLFPPGARYFLGIPVTRCRAGETCYLDNETRNVKANQSNRRGRATLLGLGLDGTDGHKRITRGKNLLLLGGSQETHQRMQETAIKLNEQLQRRGKQLGEVSPRELHDMMEKAAR